MIDPSTCKITRQALAGYCAIARWPDDDEHLDAARQRVEALIGRLRHRKEYAAGRFSAWQCRANVNGKMRRIEFSFATDTNLLLLIRDRDNWNAERTAREHEAA